MESNEVITTNGKILSIEELQSEVDALKSKIILLEVMLSDINTKLGNAEITPQADDGQERKTFSDWRKEVEIDKDSGLNYQPISLYHPIL